jgi:hypothetical protein
MKKAGFFFTYFVEMYRNGMRRFMRVSFHSLDPLQYSGQYNLLIAVCAVVYYDNYLDKKIK